MKNVRHLIILLYIINIFPGCSDCDDCGPAKQEPYVNMKFYNIDSLVKVNNAILLLEDSLIIVVELIENGDDSYIPVKNEIEAGLTVLNDSKNKIEQGKIRIEELNGIGASFPVYFRDSTTNDTLSVFRFPLDMYNNHSTFLINIENMSDTIRLEYDLLTYQRGPDIILKAYDLELTLQTYDSVKVVCQNDSCISNETTVQVYF